MMSVTVGSVYATAAAGFEMAAADTGANRFLVHTGSKALDVATSFTAGNIGALIMSDSLEPYRWVSVHLYAKNVTHGEDVTWTTNRLAAFAEHGTGNWSTIPADSAIAAAGPPEYGAVHIHKTGKPATGLGCQDANDDIFPDAAALNQENTHIVSFGNFVSSIGACERGTITRIGFLFVLKATLAATNNFFFRATWVYGN